MAVLQTDNLTFGGEGCVVGLQHGELVSCRHHAVEFDGEIVDLPHFNSRAEVLCHICFERLQLFHSRLGHRPFLRHRRGQAHQRPALTPYSGDGESSRHKAVKEFITADYNASGT